MKEWKIFLTTFMYFTRIRVPASIGHDPVYLRKSPRYLPLIGWITGGISALVYILCFLWLSPGTAVLFSMIAGLLVTGALHEDGFADVCDGFGGGWNKDKILLIMKDSRIGAFGAIGLIMILLAKFLLLSELLAIPTENWSKWLDQRNHGLGLSMDDLFRPYHKDLYWLYNTGYVAMVAGHSLSRLMPVLVMRWSQNVTDPEQSKSGLVTGVSGSTIGMRELIPATLFGLAPFALLPWPCALVVLPVLGVTVWMNRWFKKWIGGYTGDCLGAIQQVTEIVTYLGIIIVWRSI